MNKFIVIIFLIFVGCLSRKGSKVDTKGKECSKSDTITISDETIELDADGVSLDEHEVYKLKSIRKIKKSEITIELDPKVSKKEENKKPINRPNENNRMGELLYSVPDTMKIGVVSKISIRIINSINQRSAITQNLTTSSNQVYRIRTSSRMQVEIKDPHSAFLIVTLNNSSIQVVDSIEYTEWLYSITPIKSGQHPLTITSSIISEDGTKDKTYHNIVYVKNDIIHKTKDFWTSEWKWLFTTLIIPFIIWFFKNRKKDKDEK